jgi:TonB family protein
MTIVKQNNPIIFCAASITAHLILLLAGIIFFEWSRKAPELGDTTQLLIKSYVYNNQTSSRNLSVISTSSRGLSAGSITRLSHGSRGQAAGRRANYSQARRRNGNDGVVWHVASEQASSPTHHTGVQTEELLAILHAAIQQQQHYPPSAMQMERQGKTTVKFTLLPNGNIQNLQIIKSSGTDSLDKAALAAVQEAVPFKKIDKYLQTSHEFSVDVVFELA